MIVSSHHGKSAHCPATGPQGALSLIRAPCTAHGKMLHSNTVQFWAQS